MLNKIIKASLDNRLVVVALSVLVLVAGCLTLMRMDVDIFPDLNAPTVVVMTEAPGLAPEEIETVVTYPVETAMNGATGVRRVRSSSTTGFSIVWVEFDWDTDIYLARQIVAERLDNVADQLPDNVSKPVMGPQSSILGETMIIGLTADSTSLIELRRIADKVIAPRLLAMGGVSQVSVIGGEAPEFQIRFNPEKMQRLGVSLSEVMDAAQGVNDNSAGGIIYDFGNEYIVKGAVNTSDLDEIGAAVVRGGTSPGDIVTLADVAEISVGGRKPLLGLASVDMKPAVIMTVTKQPAKGTLGLTEDIDGELAAIAPSLPSDVHVNSQIFRQSDFIDASVSNLGEALFEGALFVIIILFIFLMNIRTTVISVVALPLSIIVTVLVLHALGITINTMSLGGIAIAIGCLVDDAIVDVENVYKRLRMNRNLPPSERKSTLDVIFHASAEVRMPIFNSTLIIVAAFVPLFFLTGIEGRMLKPLGVAFIVALGVSTVVALTVTPVLCSFLLGNRKENETLSREPRLTVWLKKAYTSALAGALSHKKFLLGATGVLFAGACVLIFTLGRGFLPSFNEGSFTINVSALPGISLEESDKIGREAERIILETPEVITVGRKTGRAELDEHSFGANASEIEAPYRLEKGGRTRNEIARDLRSRLSEIPGVSVEIGQPISHRIDAMLSGTQSQIAIKVFGSDLNTLFAIGKNIHSVVKGIDGIVDANIEQQVERPEIVIRPNRRMLAQYGVKMQDFNRVIAVALAGEKVSQVYEGGFSYDVTLIADEDHRSSIEDIRRLSVDTPAGPVTLGTIADISSTTGPNTVNRENVKRRLVISANVDGRDLRGAVDEIRKHVAESVQMPEGYYISYGGQFENEESASRTLLWTSLGALLVIFMLLYAEFKRLSQALVILVNMPLALIGGVMILAICGDDLNIPAIIGFISLMGISTRNGMLLMTRYNHLEAEGMPLTERIMSGSADRLLPIVMTALTSALALVPIAINGDEPGNEIQAPMALVILGGLVTSTALNIFVVPALYQLIQNRSKK